MVWLPPLSWKKSIEKENCTGKHYQHDKHQDSTLYFKKCQTDFPTAFNSCSGQLERLSLHY